MFKKYVLCGRTLNSLSQESGYSVKTLANYIHGKLDHKPSYIKIPKLIRDKTYLVIDAVWFGKKLCLLLFRYHKYPYILYALVARSEHSSYYQAGLSYLLKHNLRFTAIVSDEAKGIKRAIAKTCPHITHQICMAHIHRQATNGLGRKSQDFKLQKLKQLADHIWLIESKEALTWWKKELNNWSIAYKSYLSEYTHDDKTHKWWFTHKNARKTIRILKNSPNLCFKFLDHPLMPKTSNGVEGLFSNLKAKWRVHRGLRRSRWSNFLLWFVYFRNQKYLSQNNYKQD